MKICLDNVIAKGNTSNLTIEHWKIESGHCWGIFSAEGDIGSLLGDLLCGELLPIDGTLDLGGLKVAQVSLSEQQRLLDSELKKMTPTFLTELTKAAPSMR